MAIFVHRHDIVRRGWRARLGFEEDSRPKADGYPA